MVQRKHFANSITGVIINKKKLNSVQFISVLFVLFNPPTLKKLRRQIAFALFIHLISILFVSLLRCGRYLANALYWG